MSRMENADLNSKLAHDAKRAGDQKHKWKLGDWSAVAGGKPRPWHVPHKQLPRDKPRFAPSKLAPYQDGTGGSNRKVPTLGDDVLTVSQDPSLGPYSTSSSSAESVQHGSRAPEPDAGVAYSFDAARGPTDGSDILGQAMNKAVERFEDKKTTRLVKDEYDVVKPDEDDEDEPEMAEDFELVGKFEL